jgi:hypothetical protein
MNRPPILKPNETYTFSKYFELAFDPEDILAELGCSLWRSLLKLPKFEGEFDSSNLKSRLEQDLIYVDLTSETARREVVIAPVLLELCRYTGAKLKIEYPIVVSDRLKGSVDYYLQAKNNLLVVEAKNADLARGFTQLAVELIALDRWTDFDNATLYGAVTTGDVWKFGLLHRLERRIVQDINLYRVPADLEELLKIMAGILLSENSV